MSTLIGTGFYSSAEDHAAKLAFFNLWLQNTGQNNPVVVVDNSTLGLVPNSDVRVLRLERNLGHMCAPQIPGRLLGWSMSWILPALIAYAENCDFVYKEQDCLAFGDWLPEIRRGRAAFGSHHRLECENSLFWIERDFIPDFVQVYMGIPETDATYIVERKFAMMQQLMPGAINRHSLGPGRSRPLPISSPGPWYAQQLTPAEIEALRAAALI